MGDIGTLFPDTDPKYKGISSIFLLKEVGKILEEHAYIIGNLWFAFWASVTLGYRSYSI